MNKFVDLSGTDNGYIKVIGFYGYSEKGKSGKRIGLWSCECRCGKIILRRAYAIKKCHPKSCGCYVQARRGNRKRHDYHTKHGLANKHALYRTWKNMKQRCYNPNNKHFYTYGGRGIKVCEEWLTNAKSFYDWGISNGWKPRLSIDRIDNDGNYSPENCQWITIGENNIKKSIQNPKKGSKAWCATLTEEQVKNIRIDLASGMRPYIVRDKYGLSRNTIYQISKNITWRHVI